MLALSVSGGLCPALGYMWPWPLLGGACGYLATELRAFYDALLTIFANKGRDRSPLSTILTPPSPSLLRRRHSLRPPHIGRQYLMLWRLSPCVSRHAFPPSPFRSASFLSFLPRHRNLTANMPCVTRNMFKQHPFRPQPHNFPPFTDPGIIIGGQLRRLATSFATLGDD